jgi:hypothetical protein
VAGYVAWLAGHGQSPGRSARLYAASLANWLPGPQHAGHDTVSWLPNGAITPVTSPLVHFGQ